MCIYVFACTTVSFEIDRYDLIIYIEILNPHDLSRNKYKHKFQTLSKTC